MGKRGFRCGTMIAPTQAAARSGAIVAALAVRERDVFSCDYNGWADVPEEEREAIETFEAGLPAYGRPKLPFSALRRPGVPLPPRSKAA